MLSVVPTVRRKCSVRSVATAAKLKPVEAQSGTDLLQTDRAAALARSKSAPKPQTLDETSPQAGPSKYTSPDAGTGQQWGTRLATTSKWARPTPPASPPQFDAARPAPKFVGSSLPTYNSAAAQNSSRRRPFPSLAVDPPVFNTTPHTSGNYENTPERARSRWAARTEASGPRPDEPRTASGSQGSFPSPSTSSRQSTKQWSMPASRSLPSHLNWQRPEPPASPSPRMDSSAATMKTIDMLLLGNNKNDPPEPRPQRVIAPHLDPQKNKPPPDPRLQRAVAPHLDAQLLQNKAPADFRHQRPPHLQRSQDPDSHQRSSHLDRPAPRTKEILAAATPEIGTNEKISRSKFKERGSLLLQTTDTVTPVVGLKTGSKPKKAWAYVEKHVTQDVYIPSTVSVQHLSRLLGVRLEDLQDKMFYAGMEAQASFDYVLTADYAVLLAEEFGRKPIVNDEAAFDLYPPPPHANSDTLPTRPPVITIMGHVDHGKTTLLDTLRSSSVAQGEVGGITQHIGAFSVPVPSANGAGPQSITFLDTPGHAAFSAMRARGAQVTDIIVLVVAADDGIMPQTREVIELIKKDREKVGVVVAINKIDKPGCNVDSLQKALLVEDIHLEELGGDVPSVEVSGLTGKGLPDLVETLSLMAEIQDLRAEPDGTAFGYVLESKVVKGLGAIATVLVLRGCLKPGSHILSGVHHAKIRIMHDSNGKMVKTASPGMAITVSGWKSLPNAGDEVLQGSESDIKRAIINRERKADIEASLADMEAINSSRQQERERRQAEADAETAGATASAATKEEESTGPKELRLLIKADVSGSAEAVEGALQGIGNHLAITKIISSNVGDITESDVMKAKAVGGMIVGFSVSSNRAVDTLAGKNDVRITTNDIIYRLMEEVKARVIDLLPVTQEFKVVGEAKVLQLFEIKLKGKQMKTVAGSRVVNGIIESNKSARVIRDGITIFEGSFETMRHFKKDVSELRKGTECGLNLAGFDDLRVDDVIQTYETIQKPGVL